MHQRTISRDDAMRHEQAYVAQQHAHQQAQQLREADWLRMNDERRLDEERRHQDQQRMHEANRMQEASRMQDMRMGEERMMQERRIQMDAVARQHTWLHKKNAIDNSKVSVPRAACQLNKCTLRISRPQEVSITASRARWA
jgi:hypothetical protein